MRLLSITAAVLALAVPAAALAETPLERTRALIETFKQVKTVKDGETLAAADRTANQATFKKLDGYFDYQVLTAASIAPHRAKLTPAQQRKLTVVFGDLLRLTSYVKSGSLLQEAQLKVAAGPSADDVTIDASIPSKDVSTTVVFHWKNERGMLRIVDVSMDGASLIKDYAAQFGRVIQKSGPQALIDKLSSQLEKERQKQGA